MGVMKRVVEGEKIFPREISSCLSMTIRQSMVGEYRHSIAVVLVDSVNIGIVVVIAKRKVWRSMGLPAARPVGYKPETNSRFLLEYK
jgi:hypothetical protein